MMKRKSLNLILICLLLGFPLAQAKKKEPQKANLEFVGYWQNYRNTATLPLRLTEIPQGYSIVIVAFASVNPYGHVKFTLQGPPYKAMANGQSQFRSDLKSLQRRGIKVLLSLGGLNSFFHLDDEKKALEFISSLKAIINDYGFDGFDYNLESDLNKNTLSNLLTVTQKIRNDFINKGRPLLISTAPEAIDVNWQVSQGKYDSLIDADLVDIISVQLYNTGCKRSFKAKSPCYKPGTLDFIVSQADSTIQTWIKRGVKNPEEKYLIGLPSSKRAATNGYVDPQIANKALSCLRTGVFCESYKPTKKYPKIGGIMMWNINWDAKNDYAFFDEIGED